LNPPQLTLLDNAGNVLRNNDYPDLNSNLDGSGNDNVEGDALIYGYAVPATGTYYWRVSDLSTGQPGGQYELFTVPEPTAGLLLVLCVPLFVRKRVWGR